MWFDVVYFKLTFYFGETPRCFVLIMLFKVVDDRWYSLLCQIYDQHSSWSASYSERTCSSCLLSVWLLQLHADQHGGRGREQCGAGRRVSPGGERTLQQAAGEHAAERHPGSHQRLQQRSARSTTTTTTTTCVCFCKLCVFLCADPNILNAIYNSEALNDVFISNFQKDPTLTWQFFGSSTGFFRIYPGEKKKRRLWEKNFTPKGKYLHFLAPFHQPVRTWLDVSVCGWRHTEQQQLMCPPTDMNCVWSRVTSVWHCGPTESGFI